MTRQLVLGIESFLADPPSWFKSARMGLLVHQASYTGTFQSTWSAIAHAGGRVSCIFSPQHGFHGEKQANMIESDHGWNAELNIPILSLYGEVRQPTEEMLQRVDVLVVDLQDVGTRVYTYGATLGLCLEAAAKHQVKLVVLDRPNPINGVAVEGNVVQSDCRSFVGLYPLPMRHGMTLGELAAFVCASEAMECDLEIYPMRGWQRTDDHRRTGLPWFFPSPNMPSWETALLYPGMVLLEGTNVSEGRGTTLPFQLFGAPFLDQKRLSLRLRDYPLDGMVLRPVTFEPVFDKWKGELCHGFEVHVTDSERFRPYRFGLALLQALRETHETTFRWLPPPYEYEWEKQPIDILIGDRNLRERLEAGTGLLDLEASWEVELGKYLRQRDGCLLRDYGIS